jgi:hypothetical protein
MGKYYVIFEVIMAVTMNVTVFWHVPPCGLERDASICYPENRESTFILNI